MASCLSKWLPELPGKTLCLKKTLCLPANRQDLPLCSASNWQTLPIVTEFLSMPVVAMADAIVDRAYALGVN